MLDFGVRYEQAIVDWLGALPFELAPAGATGAVDAVDAGAITPGKLHRIVERVAVLAPMISELKPVVRASGLTAAATDGEPKRHTGRAGNVTWSRR